MREPDLRQERAREERDGAAESALAIPGPAAWLSHRDLVSARLAACQAIDTARAVLDLRGSMRNAAHVIDELRTGQGF